MASSSKFADDPKLSAAVDTPEGWDASQRASSRSGPMGISLGLEKQVQGAAPAPGQSQIQVEHRLAAHRFASVARMNTQNCIPMRI